VTWLYKFYGVLHLRTKDLESPHNYLKAKYKSTNFI
jgi:hypothetical protein